MIKASLISYLKFGNVFYSVEESSFSNEEIYYGIEIKRDKDLLDIKSKTETKNIDELINKISKRTPVHLIINNTSVLTKSIIYDGKVDDELGLIDKAFPNINIDDFYYEILKQEFSAFITICRKTIVHDSINRFVNKKISLINITLGTLLVSEIKGFVEDDSLLVSNALILFEGKSIKSIEKNTTKTNKNYDINGLQLSSDYILSFTSVLNSITDEYKTYNNLNLKIKNLVVNFKYERFRNAFLKFGLVSIFILLLINSLAFNHYFNKTLSLKQNTVNSSSLKQELITLNKKVVKTEKMVEDIQNSESSNSSQLINMFVLTLPETITLEEVSYQPLLKRIEDGKPILKDLNSILVKGVSINSEFYSIWIQELEILDWIDHTEVLSYEDKLLDKALFTLKIIIND